jgi:hypothetical protein
MDCKSLYSKIKPLTGGIMQPVDQIAKAKAFMVILVPSLVGSIKKDNLLTHKILKDFEAARLLTNQTNHVIVCEPVPISTMKQIQRKTSQVKKHLLPLIARNVCTHVKFSFLVAESFKNRQKKR